MLSFCNWWKNYTNRNNENIQTVRRLTSGQSPRFIEDLLQEGWLKFEIFRDDIETEEMTVDASARHGVLVAQLMAVASLNEQIHSLLNLKPANSMFVKCLPLTDLVLCNTRSVNSKHVCICMHTTYNKNDLEISTYRGIRVLHRLDPFRAFDGTGAHGFCAALTEQASHGCFVCQAESASVAVVRQLKD